MGNKEEEPLPAEERREGAAMRLGPGSLPTAHISACQGPHLGQLAVLVFQDDLIFLQLLQFGLSGHLLQLQLLAGTFLLFQLFLQFLPQRWRDHEEHRPHEPS